TFLSSFNDFDIIEVQESEKYLIDSIHEQYMYQKMVPMVHDLAEIVTEDSNRAVEFLMTQTDKIAKLSAQYKEGYDIVQNEGERRVEYKFRNEADGILGVTTGVKVQEDITYVTKKEALIINVGCTEVGKTWDTLY